MLAQKAAPALPPFPAVFVLSSAPYTQPILSPEAQAYVQTLCSYSLDSILDSGEGEATCKALGQSIFDKYKTLGRSSEAGKKGGQLICDSIYSTATDGRLRKQYIERCWNGIGDSSWRWIA